MLYLSYVPTAFFFAARQAPHMNWERLPSLILGLVGLGIFVAIAWYILSKIREGEKQEETSPSEMLTRFGELYRSGEITREEYQAIRMRLAASLAAMKTEKDEADSKSKKGAAALDRSAELERLLEGERR